MPRPLLFLVLALMLGSQAAGAPPDSNSSGLAATYAVVAAPVTRAQASADEYFGRYRLSNLRVRNAIHDMTIEGNSPRALPQQVDRCGCSRVE